MSLLVGAGLAAAAVALVVPESASSSLRRRLGREVLHPGRPQRLDLGERTRPATPSRAHLGPMWGTSTLWAAPVAAVLVSLLFSVVVGVLAGAAAALVVVVRGRSVLRSESENRRARVVGLCVSLTAELRGGLAVTEALGRCLTGDPRDAETFRRTVVGLRAGGDIPAAIRLDAAQPGAAGLRALAACWEVSEGSGAAMASGLARLSASLRSEESHRREVRAALSAPRATARLLAGLPVVGLVLGSGLGVDPVGLLLGTPVGLVLLGSGALLSGAGVLWTERLARAADPDGALPDGALPDGAPGSGLQ